MAKQPKIHAIVVGVDQYEMAGALRGCVNDATAFAGRLEQLPGKGNLERLYLNDGYHPQQTPTRSHVLAAVNRAVDNVEADDYLFFYFAGHGVHDKEHGHCLLPIDFVRNEYRETSLRLDSLVSRLRASRSNNVVLFLDVCREFIDGRGLGEPEQRFFDSALRLPGILMFAACLHGQVSIEINPRSPRGLFTSALLEAWSPAKPGLTFDSLYEDTKRRMSEIVAEMQIQQAQQCSLAAEPLEKAQLLVPEWIMTPQPKEHSLTIEYPTAGTLSATVSRCAGCYSGELSAWGERRVWINLLDLNGNRYLQQPEVALGADGTWVHENICSGGDIVALEALWVSETGRASFEQKVRSHSFGAFRSVPDGTLLLDRVKLG